MPLPPLDPPRLARAFYRGWQSWHTRYGNDSWLCAAGHNGESLPWLWGRRVDLTIHTGEEYMRPFTGVLSWLPWLLLTACVASQPEAPTAGPGRAAVDRILTPGDIHVAEARLQAFGYDPSSVDGLFTAQTEAALRAFQRRYGLTVTGLLDRETRRELVPGLDPVRSSSPGWAECLAAASGGD